MDSRSLMMTLLTKYLIFISASWNMSSLAHVHLSQNDLDVATANFDQTFTRMALETMDNGSGAEGEAAADDGKAEEELNADTFVGFTFHESDAGRTKGRDGGGRIRGSGHHPQQQTQQPPPSSSQNNYHSHGPRR